VNALAALNISNLNNVSCFTYIIIEKSILKYNFFSSFFLNVKKLFEIMYSILTFTHANQIYDALNALPVHKKIL